MDLNGTALQDRHFSPISHGVFDEGHPLGDNWLTCTVKSGVFEGTGDPTKLEAILKMFLAWAQRRGS